MSQTIPQALGLDAFNAASRDEAIGLLRPCVDVDRWCEQIADGRPYASIDELVARAESAADPFTPEELEAALAHHPRIGERAAGEGREAELSRAEQSAVDPDAAVQRALREGNEAYEERFDRVFLIRAAGRSAREILTQLRERLQNPPDVEERIVGEQLREIAVLRLKGAVTP